MSAARRARRKTGSGADPAGAHAVDLSPRAIRKASRYGGVAAAICSQIFRLFGRRRTLHAENLPADGPLIVAAYHANYLDPILVGMALREKGRMPHYLAKASLFKPPLGLVLRRLGQIPVLRNSAHSGDSLAYAREALDAGATVVIYPDGTLTKDPELWPQSAKSGVARLAIETGVPVLPMAHWGLETAFPRGAKLPHAAPTAPLDVTFGPVIDPHEYGTGPAAIAALGRRITSEIAAEVAELRHLELPERFGADLGSPARRAAQPTAADHDKETR